MDASTKVRITKRNGGFKVRTLGQIAEALHPRTTDSQQALGMKLRSIDRIVKRYPAARHVLSIPVEAIYEEIGRRYDREADEGGPRVCEGCGGSHDRETLPPEYTVERVEDATGTIGALRFGPAFGAFRVALDLCDACRKPEPVAG